MAVDLSPAVRALENLMDDTCKVTRDPQGTTDDVFDQTTGLYTPPVNDTSTVYVGKCQLSTNANVGRQGDRGGGSFQIVGYKISIPLTAAPLRKGDWVECTGSLRDKAMIGKRFQVESPIYSTLVASRRATMTSEEQV